MRHRWGLPAGNRRQKRTHRAGQILETFREDGFPAPRVELSRYAFRRMSSQEIAIPHPEPVELRAVGGVQRRQLTVQVVRVEQPGLELTYRCEQRICEPTEAGRPAEAVERLTCERAAHDEGPLRFRRDRP